MVQRVIEIGGMTCVRCMSRVRDALSALPGVTVDRMKVGQATVSFDESATDAATIEKAIEDAGYDVLQMS
jgi:copper chaperone CopZ